MFEHQEDQYLNLLRDILENGDDRMDRTGVGRKSVFVRQMRFDLKKGFPLLTTKKINLKTIADELFWFIKGDTNIRFLLENQNNIWNEWPFQRYVNSKDYVGPDMSDFGVRVLKDPEFKEIYKEELKKFKQRILTDDAFALQYGELGEVYGKQWRSWTTPEGQIDQFSNVLHELKTNPFSSRLLVNSWNVGKLKGMQLPPCHYSFQFFVNSKGELSCLVNMRSVDTFLGLPFNIASYALLTHMVALECGMEVGELVWSGADVHIYMNHIEQVNLQLQREPRPFPTLSFDFKGKEKPSIFDIKYEDIVLTGYDPHPFIKGEVAV